MRLHSPRFLAYPITGPFAEHAAIPRPHTSSKSFRISINLPPLALFYKNSNLIIFGMHPFNINLMVKAVRFSVLNGRYIQSVHLIRFQICPLACCVHSMTDVTSPSINPCPDPVIEIILWPPPSNARAPLVRMATPPPASNVQHVASRCPPSLFHAVPHAVHKNGHKRIVLLWTGMLQGRM